jgi:hypothetical protein
VPRERPSICSPEVGPTDPNGQLGRLQAPAANLSPEEVKTRSIDQDPPDVRPGTTPEPMATEPSADSLIPAPDSEGTEAAERAETQKQSQDDFWTAEVRRRWIERIAL